MQRSATMHFARVIYLHISRLVAERRGKVKNCSANKKADYYAGVNNLRFISGGLSVPPSRRN